jgi:hypothetical protein
VQPKKAGECLVQFIRGTFSIILYVTEYIERNNVINSAHLIIGSLFPPKVRRWMIKLDFDYKSCLQSLLHDEF